MTVLKLQQLERTRTDCGLSKGVMALCAHCGQPFKAKRPDARYCSRACKQAGHRARLSVTESANLPQKASTYLTAQKRPKPSLQVIEIIDTGVTDKPISKKFALRFERVNSVTIKVTDGEIIRTPAQPGKWGGCNTTRAVAWLMEAGWVSGPQAWVARTRNSPTVLVRSMELRRLCLR